MTEPTARVAVEPAAPTRRLPCLVVLNGRDRGRILGLQRNRIMVGRDARAGIRLDGPGISRRHAELQLRAGQVWLIDLDSTNGCWCNGRRVQRAPLRDGDQLQLGGARLMVRYNHPEEGQLLRQLYLRATRDALTGLLNRASLLERLEREARRQSRYGRGLSVVLADLDRFKAVNDRHGHAVGDQALVAAARAMGACLRDTDLAARLGGEEFVLVLPEVDLEAAQGIAEKVRAAIEAQALRTPAGALRLTASLGVAVAPAGAVRGEELLLRADRACYRAKAAGRNRVEIDRGPA